MLVNPKPSETPPRERHSRRKSGFITVQSEDQKAHSSFLAAVSFGISSWVATAIILAGMGFSTAAAFPIAHGIAASVFGGSLYRIYRTSSKTPPRCAKPVTQHCLVLAAPIHCVLQDRANYWLSGKYGKVISSHTSTTEKGFYMVIFYEADDIKALPLKQGTEE